MGYPVRTIIGLFILIADIWAIVNISPPSAGAKALWILLVVLPPVLGLIVWFVAGPKANTV